MLNVKFRDARPEDEYCYREILEIWHNGKIIKEYWDGGEPEDNSFTRDWNWVSFAIEEAYKLGVEDGIAKQKEKIDKEGNNA